MTTAPPPAQWEAAVPRAGTNPGLAALGPVIVFAAGFAPSEAVHDAAHDTRHPFAFPCH